MKKLLGLLAVAAILWPAAASAEVLKNVDLIGEVQVIGSDVRQNQAKAYNSGTNARALAGLSFDLVEDVRANLLFQYAYSWGDNNLNNNGFDNAKGMKLAEANVVLSNLFDCFEATIGRQFYGDENSAVMYFGPNHYNAEGLGYASTLDAVKFNYYDDVKSFTILAGKVNTYTLDATTGDEKTLDANTAIYGADLKLNLTEGLMWQLYGYDLRNVQYWDGAAVAEYKNIGFYGTKLAFTSDVLDLSGEYARNFAGERLVKEPKDTGYMAKFDAALHLDAFTPRAAFVYSADDFLAYGNYTPGLLIGQPALGKVYNMFDGGLRLFNVGVDYKTGKWTFALDGYSFQDRYAHKAATLEADLTAKYAHNEYVELFAGVGYAKYGTDQKEDGYGKDNTKGQLGMLVKF